MRGISTRVPVVLDAAVTAAARAFPAWSALTAAERKPYLDRFADEIDRSQRRLTRAYLPAQQTALAGKSVRVGLRGDPIAGIVDGIDEEGSLILRTGGGRKTIVSSGEVTLRKP